MTLLMMFEGKHIHFSPVNKKPLCSYSAKLCKQKRINGYAFCIRHILEDKSAPFKQCAHVARYNKQKCTNPIPSNENREFCNSHMQVAGILPKKERKIKKEKEKELLLPGESKLKFADRLKALLTKENSISSNEDVFNSDDPYAFPDNVSESENGCLGLSNSPVLRTNWNCSKMASPDVLPSDSPVRCDQASKAVLSSDGKLKANVPKLSKTMNRLQAKIAQNKLLDKQKKTQDASQNTINLINNLNIIDNLKSDSLSPDACNRNTDVDALKTVSEIVKEGLVQISIESPESHSKTDATSSSMSSNPSSDLQNDHSLTSPGLKLSSAEKDFCTEQKSPQSDNADTNSKNDSINNNTSNKDAKRAAPESTGKVPHVLQKMQRLLENKKKKYKYILPFSLDPSESESSDSEEESTLFARLSWFSAWDRIGASFLDGTKSDSRSTQRAWLKRELNRSYRNLLRLHKLHKQGRNHQQEMVETFVKAAQNYPDQASELLMSKLKGPVKQKKINKPPQILKRKCCFKDGDLSCKNPVLPYTMHCKKHIMYNTDQVLFEHCTAKFSDNTQCRVPVFDVTHELPLCLEHATKRDNYNKMASEPKPKRPRKKPKPSALTRPPKRGKKKKKPNIVRPTPAMPPPVAQPAAAAPPPPPPPSIQKVPTPPPQLPPLQTPPPPPIPTAIATTDNPEEMPNTSSFNGDVLKPVDSVLSVSDLEKDLNGQMPPELGSDLEDQFSPGAIEKTLELPLDTAELANQATKLLEEHDFTEVLNKIPDDAFNDLFVDTKNGDYIPSREETEELERALAAVSKDVHLARESLAKLSSGTGPDLEELERTIEIHGGLLGADGLTSAIDETTFNELTNSHIDSLNSISSSFSTSDLNSLSQALSAIGPEGLDQSNLCSVADTPLIPTSVVALPLISSDLSNPHVLNGHSGVLADLHSLQLDATFVPNLLENPVTLNTSNSTQTQAVSDARIVGNASLLSTVLFNIGQNSTSAAATPQTFTAASDEAGSSGSLTSTHWLLNSSDQAVLALSQLAYQNGFLLTSQSGAASYAGAKYPLQTLGTDVSLVSSDSALVTATGCNTENVIRSTADQPHNLNVAPSLQQTASVTVIAQEGAS